MGVRITKTNDQPEPSLRGAGIRQEGIVKSRELVVPMAKVASAALPIRLALKAAELGSLRLFNPEHLRPMPDHWDVPVGFNERDFFMVGGGGWIAAPLPFDQTSSAVSETPKYETDTGDADYDPPEPDIARATAVYDSMAPAGVVQSLAAGFRTHDTGEGSFHAHGIVDQEGSHD